MRHRIKQIIEQSNRLFEKRRPILSLWQELALNFYPMRADFTTVRSISEEFASHLMTGRPVLAHRDLGNAISAMLRPRGTPWFHPRTDDETINNDATARQWLDAKGDVMRRVMYDRPANFIRATKQGDNDFAAFGQCVIEVSPNRELNGLLYRPWHLRDVVWCEDEELQINRVDRTWKLEAYQMAKLFPKTVHKEIERCLNEEPYREFEVRHIVLPADQYEWEDEKKGKRNLPFVSLYVDITHEVVLEETPRKRLGYVIPRWVTVSGSQYAHSIASVIALPDARLLQQMTLTLLEAGQKAVDPPLKATAEAVSGTVNIYAGGITWVDAEYDERQGKALEAIMDAPPALNWGIDREAKIESLIAEAFFLNRITLPTLDSGQMTAYETQKRIEEYIRGALPLFEPMEVEYNGAICEETFNLIMDMGGFGPLDDIPPMLRGQDVQWQFESPLQAANERAKSQAFMQSAELLKVAAAIDPNVVHDFNTPKAFRDAMSATARADWIVPEEQADEAKAAAAEQAQIQEAAAAISQGAGVAAQVGVAGQELAAAGVM